MFVKRSTYEKLWDKFRDALSREAQMQTDMWELQRKHRALIEEVGHLRNVSRVSPKSRRVAA